MIDILFFAELQEQAGVEKTSVKGAGLTVSELKDQLLAEYELATIDNAMIAINEEYAQTDEVLQAGDVVAFIPPVSGG